MDGKNPLECVVCNKEFVDPVHLPCEHTVCAACVPKKTRASCPVCHSAFDESLAVADPLVSFLIDSANETAEVCANCDQVSQPMFFCETCQQSLCQQCRVNTHKARMFSTHRVVPLEERAKVRGRVVCARHGEPYILYCADDKQLVCIQCFNGRPLEARHSFISIDNAHKHNVEKVEKWTGKLRAFQEEKREEVEVRERMVRELREAHDTAKNSIYQLCQEVMDTVMSVRDKMTTRFEEEREKKSKECRKQIQQLEGIMSPIRLYLLSAQMLCASASKIDFLHLSIDLVKRIQNTLTRSPSVRPCPTKSTDTESARSELMRAVEPHLGMASWLPSSASAREGSGSQYKARSGSGYATASGTNGGGSVSMLTKYQMMIDLAGAFGELFARIDAPIKDFRLDMADLGRRVQETQRDLTQRRCLIAGEKMEELVKDCMSLETRLGMHSAVMDELQPEMQHMWQEQLDRVRRQQIIFREKMDDVLGMRDTARQILTGARQLAPFAACIERMTAAIDPKRCHPPDPAPMESICLQITGMEPDSQQRIQAIEKEEQHRRAAQEAARREEEAEHAGCVQKLRPKKGGQKQRRERILVNTIRERSPGGTDIALLSPCNRHRISPSLREELHSEYGEWAADRVDSPLPEHSSETDPTEQSPEGAESDEVLAEVEMICHARSASAECTRGRREYTSVNSPVWSLHSQLPSRPSSALSHRVIENVGASRESMLRSLQDLFAEQRAFSDDDANMLASAVKIAQKRPTRRQQRLPDKKAPPTPATPPQAPPTPGTPPTHANGKLGLIPASLLAQVPFLPRLEGVAADQVEAKERLLWSLKERVSKYDASPSPERQT